MEHGGQSMSSPSERAYNYAEEIVQPMHDEQTAELWSLAQVAAKLYPDNVLAGRAAAKWYGEEQARN